MALSDNKIATYARGEMPQTWDVLLTDKNLGEEFLGERLNSIMMKLFGEILSDGVVAALDVRVLDYAGKILALELINPGIDYWGKQPLSAGARNENKSYADRASHLRELRKMLLEQTRLMWPEVEALLPGRRGYRGGSVPRVRDITVAHTPNPYDFERPFGDRTGGA